MLSAVRLAATAAAMAFALAGCGVKGGLEAPESSKSATTADAASGQGKPEGEAAKPHEGFILDGLLR